MPLQRQIKAFFAVGIIAAVLHYGLLVGLVEGARWAAVPATLVGYVAGGIVSYLLNRRHTFTSVRAHHEAAWRFAAVAGVGFGLTWLAMRLLVENLCAPYLPAQLLTTAVVQVWSFAANKLWTFGG